jgi:hypothetical protein
MTFEGFFELNDARDLFKKLERDYHRLQENPLDQDAAFDFFVTAYHMLEWAYPGHSAKRNAMEKDTVLLKIASHLANSAKHFRLTQPKHTYITGLEKQDGAFQTGAFQADAFDIGRLEIHLEGDAAAELGDSIGALPLAEMLLHFWRKELNL